MEVQISQDIRKYKTKDIGNFSFKEAGFVAVGLAAAWKMFRCWTKNCKKVTRFIWNMTRKRKQQTVICRRTCTFQTEKWYRCG